MAGQGCPNGDIDMRGREPYKSLYFGRMACIALSTDARAGAGKRVPAPGRGPRIFGRVSNEVGPDLRVQEDDSAWTVWPTVKNPQVNVGDFDASGEDIERD
ncbi:hypothetical protein GCM10017600_27030 [Streptosporangium carneum]|uniref:Uncharacterized protein n=1 Tax=Streptosporangium carneum TaxID=47481 RepID=A0A9W6MCR3_9ACTN|nr:hypothetical protein GCM10017600_27030 [Streptosporangium carneum]